MIIDIQNLNTSQLKAKDDFFELLTLMKQTLNTSPLLESLTFDFIIAGGAIRETLLNKVDQIQDIDLILTYNLKANSPEYLKQNSEKTPIYMYSESINSIEELFKKEKNLASKTLNNTAIHTADKISLLIEEVLKNTFSIYKKYSSITKIEETVHNQRNYSIANINSVLKGYFKDYKLDIIMTDINHIKFLKDFFDFDICKAGLFLNSNSESEFYITREFESDANNEILSFNVTDFSIREIENSLSKHMPKILAKYPEFKKVKLKGSVTPEKEAILDYHLLKLKLEENREQSKIKQNNFKI